MFQPLVPFSGTAGWEFLQRTRDRQQETFEKTPSITRNTDAFRERIATIRSAEELVADRELLQVALGAFGLDEDIGNTYLIARILESDTASRDSLTSRFADKRYQSLSAAFGFGSVFGPRTQDAGFATGIIDAYNDRQFEIAVGNQSPNLRLAMGIDRELNAIVTNDALSADAAWFSVMANKPLRTVFETALGLPSSFGTLDLDRQLATFRQKSEAVFGVTEVRDFSDPDTGQNLRDKFLIRSQLTGEATFMGSAATALTLLSQSARPSWF